MKVILKFYDLFRIITSSVKIHLKLRSFQIYIIIVGIGIMRKRCAHVQLEKKCEEILCPLYLVSSNGNIFKSSPFQKVGCSHRYRRHTELFEEKIPILLFLSLIHSSSSPLLLTCLYPVLCSVSQWSTVHFNNLGLSLNSHT